MKAGQPQIGDIVHYGDARCRPAIVNGMLVLDGEVRSLDLIVFQRDGTSVLKSEVVQEPDRGSRWGDYWHWPSDCEW